GEQGIDIVGHDVDLPTHLFCLSRLQSSQPKVGMEADRHSLKEFLVRFERCRKEHRIVRRVTADQAIAGDELAERTRIDVVPVYSPWSPDLPRGIAGLRRPVACRHPL